MKRIPRLSVGLPVYNGENYLEESLDALLGQSYEDFELIVSDNSSTDGTADICHRYAKQDRRIRYVRQEQNIGLAPNHNFVFEESRGELFKWAAADDLYGRDLLKRCVQALDEHPDVVLAHAWEAAIDASGEVTQAFEYPLATNSPSAPERFRSILFGSSGLFESNDSQSAGLIRVDNQGILRACDEYGVIRADVMRRIAPQASYHHSDRVLVCELALHGPFHMTPEWLYFRRDFPDRAYNKTPTVRDRCVVMDPARATGFTTQRAASRGVRLGLRRIDPASAPVVCGPSEVLSEPRSMDSGQSDSQISAEDPHAGGVAAMRTSPARCFRPGLGGRPGAATLVTLRQRAGRIHRAEGERSAGLFGLLGQGNLGNDGSMEAVLSYLRARHPDLSIDVLCTGPQVIGPQYEIPAADVRWHRPERGNASRVPALAQRAMDLVFGMTADSVRIVSWVRRHDAVIVPGMGVLETTLPIRAWKTPYWMFLLSASGRLFGTKVAFVSTGASVIDERFIRLFVTAAARLSSYRSFRDANSRESMHRMGVDTSRDAVYPDVVFSLPKPQAPPPTLGSVGLGIMDYCGRNVDRRQADEIRASYVEKMTKFSLWLVDHGRSLPRHHQRPRC